MRRYLVIFGLFLLFLAPASFVSAKPPKIIDTQESQVGEIVFFKLPGDPGKGYKWQFNKDLSTGTNLVDVTQLGWLMADKVKSMFFQQQSKMNVAVRTKAAGQADLAFDYSRKLGGRTYTKTVIVRIIIKPQLAAQ